MMNLQLVNNLFDNSILFEVFMILALMSGLLYTISMKTDNMTPMFGNSNMEMVIIASLVVFRVFLYIQKRVHKEVFFEMKQRGAE
jgi:Ca2+/H+ antiporter